MPLSACPLKETYASAWAEFWFKGKKAGSFFIAIQNKKNPAGLPTAGFVSLSRGACQRSFL